MERASIIEVVRRLSVESSSHYPAYAGVDPEKKTAHIVVGSPAGVVVVSLSPTKLTLLTLREISLESYEFSGENPKKLIEAVYRLTASPEITSFVEGVVRVVEEGVGIIDEALRKVKGAYTVVECGRQLIILASIQVVLLIPTVLLVGT